MNDDDADAVIDWPAEETACVEMMREVCQDLAGLRLYVVAAESVPGLSVELGGAAALTAPRLDLTLRPHIPTWAGRGLAVLYSRRVLDDVAADLLPMMVHEIGHCVRDRYSEMLAVETLPTPDVAFLAAAFRPLAEQGQQIRDDVWFHHDWRWFRCVLHLRHRLAWRFRLLLSVASVIGYGWGDLPIHVHDLHRVLLESGEYDRFFDSPLRTVLDSEPPTEFMKIWNEDVNEMKKG